MTRTILYLAILLLIVPLIADAQALRDGKEGERFEVASIKPGPALGVLASLPRILPGGVLQVNGASLRDLINYAYPAVAGQISMEAAPEWSRSERFNVLAKTTTGTRPTGAMLRALLAERFKLRVRFEPREATVLELTLARNDGRLGPGLTPSNCVADDSAPEAERCKTVRIAFAGLMGDGVTIGELAGTLAHHPDLARPVLDHTGLTGRYVFDLQYRNDAVPNGDQRPDLGTALREQLGLKLSRTRATIDVLVLEHADKLEAD
jgi:uncharacterized protein (TIGR03435 family)